MPIRRRLPLPNLSSSTHIHSAPSHDARANALPREYVAWRRRATAHKEQLRDQIRAAVRQQRTTCNDRALREAVGRYLTSKDTQLLALRRAMSRGPRELGNGRELRFIDTWAAYGSGASYSDLHPYMPLSEHRFCRPVVKRSGGTRQIWEFGPKMTARQLLVLEALNPLVENRLSIQMIFSGGRVVGLNDVREALRDPTLSHFATVDIASFFDSVDLQGATQLLPVDRRVLENTLCITSERGSAFVSNSSELSNGAHGLAVCRPLGLPQGAASSSLIAHYLLEWAFERQDYEHLYPFADNLLILGSSKEDVAAKVSRYESSLVRHPAGPLRLGTIECGTITRPEGIEYLGVEFQVRDSGFSPMRKVTANVTAANHAAFAENIATRVAQDGRSQDASVPRTREFINGFLGAMPTDDHKHFIEMAANLVRASGFSPSFLIESSSRFVTPDELSALRLKYRTRIRRRPAG